MTQLVEHLHQLAEVIGPRPATTDAEAQAAEYIEGVFAERGLPVERQEFDCPRTYSWAFIIYHVLTIGAAVLANWFAWPALAIAVAVAVVMWSDLDTRWGLSRLMPKGPSQNVIARHVPKARRNERLRKVVVVAHYDSAKASLAFSPGLVKNFNLTFGLMKWLTFLTPVAILVHAVPWTRDLHPYTWYAALAVSAYLVVPLLINLHRELAMQATDGANDNASGVAAMLGIMEQTVPEPDQRVQLTQPIRRTPEAAYEADVVLEDALLTYTPVDEELHAPAKVTPARPTLDTFDDIGWETTAMPPVQQQSSFSFDEPVPAAPAYVDDHDDWDDAPAPSVPSSESYDEPHDQSYEEPKKKRRWGRTSEKSEKHGVRDWLGLGGGFDVRKEGKNIGTWDALADDDDADGFGFKGGSVGPAEFDDPRFASEEASRIRRRVTSGIDRALAEKEIWFVATGAEEVGTWGMQAFLDAYGEDLHDALFINIDNIGSGALCWITSEGMARRYHCDRRLASSAKRVARENELAVRGREYRGLSTDATPALARRFKAMSVMAFDINGRLPHWHWHSDTVENVDEVNLTLAADFVTKLIREL
ncbi:MAG: M28 family peptidase [Coriobacteriia bacterium]|nr:M28 family peptidase [Coriobacteriia bacterium]